MVSNTNRGFDESLEARHPRNAQAVLSAGQSDAAGQLDAIHVPQHGKSRPHDTVGVHEADGSSQLPAKEEQKLITLRDEESQNMPNGTTIIDPHLPHRLAFEQTRFNEACTGKSVNVCTMELGRMVQRARRLEVRRKQLSELMIVLQTQYICSRRKLTAHQNRIQAAVAKSWKRHAEAQDLRRQAAEVERQSDEHLKQAEYLQREAKCQAEEFSRQLPMLSQGT